MDKSVSSRKGLELWLAEAMPGTVPIGALSDVSDASAYDHAGKDIVVLKVGHEN